MSLEVFLVRKDFLQIVHSVLQKNNVYLWGEAGSGKTQLAINIGQYIKDNLKTKKNIDISVYILTITQWTSPIDLIGGETPNGYREGLLEKSWKNGGILILDELPKIEPNTSGILNTALAQTKIAGSYITNGRGETIKKHPHFYVIGTGNTDMRNISASYGANYKQDLSLIDRFSGSFFYVSKDEAFEKLLLEKNTGKKFLGLYEFMDLVRKAVTENEIDTIVSIRTISTIASMCLAKPDVQKGILPSYFISNYFKSSFTKEEYNIINNYINEITNKSGLFNNISAYYSQEFYKSDKNNFIDMFISLSDVYDSSKDVYKYLENSMYFEYGKSIEI
ncbi:MAG: AAA family ATPase [Candidatus Omnitrophica bacterium]|nr:AAA family ATPase [Candidatus Omnitrophota bacterium]